MLTAGVVLAQASQGWIQLLSQSWPAPSAWQAADRLSWLLLLVVAARTLFLPFYLLLWRSLRGTDWSRIGRARFVCTGVLVFAGESLIVVLGLLSWHGTNLVGAPSWLIEGMLGTLMIQASLTLVGVVPALTGLHRHATGSARGHPAPAVAAAVVFAGMAVPPLALRGAYEISTRWSLGLNVHHVEIVQLNLAVAALCACLIVFVLAGAVRAPGLRCLVFLAVLGAGLGMLDRFAPAATGLPPGHLPSMGVVAAIVAMAFGWFLYEAVNPPPLPEGD